ncbi:LacI family DNA-binding transcriptional regulator [Microbacterium deminutum]|uniref:LacI family DNA-binding transcriptional regulator n=1 Tax=Microbacterium deminutum TaxID=344164 RepID=A0ABN2Q524_9MICO
MDADAASTPVEIAEPEPATTEARSAKAATIYDVARVAGVSHQTVSRFIKGYQGIRPETRDRVVAALEQLDYRPNLTARSLRKGRSHRIAALTHEIDQVGPSKIVQGASVAAREAGYLLDIVTLDMSDRLSIQEALELVQQLDVAGVLALASTDEMAAAFAAADFRVPALIRAEEDDAQHGHPTELSTLGIPALMSHLVALGHERFLHIAGPSTWSAARNRSHAYDMAISAHGLVSTGVVSGDWSAKSGYDAVAALPPDFTATAVVASNDQMALGAMLALRDRGLRVPDDVSVTGVDDIPEAAYFSPPLTTLRIDFDAQGRSAVAELLGGARAHAPAIGSELIIRASTGPVHSAR